MRTRSAELGTRSAERGTPDATPIGNERASKALIFSLLSMLVATASLAQPSIAAACPFCTAVGPSFAERRAECDALVVGERNAAGRFTVHQVWKGREALGDVESIEASADAAMRAGDLALLLGRQDDGWSWETLPADESSLAYFARMPDAAQPWSVRLRYAAKFLEHDSPQVADDAYREFGQAPFDAVVEVADAFDYARVRGWLTDAAVADERKGLYGLLLGLARNDADRLPNAALLRQAVVAPTGDFRAGFDGILGGFLWAEGTAALDLIDARLLRDPQSPEGDVRHAQTALRFYQQYGRAIPAERLKQSLALFLDRPGTAAGAVQDFTRRKDWEFTARCEALFAASPGDDATLDRAVVGYLLLCPDPAAAEALSRLRQIAGPRVAEAERFLALVGIRGAS